MLQARTSCHTYCPVSQVHFRFQASLTNHLAEARLGQELRTVSTQVTCCEDRRLQPAHVDSDTNRPRFPSSLHAPPIWVINAGPTPSVATDCRGMQAIQLTPGFPGARVQPRPSCSCTSPFPWQNWTVRPTEARPSRGPPMRAQLRMHCHPGVVPGLGFPQLSEEIRVCPWSRRSL